jgi:hypothetical protein
METGENRRAGGYLTADKRQVDIAGPGFERVSVELTVGSR